MSDCKVPKSACFIWSHHHRVNKVNIIGLARQIHRSCITAHDVIHGVGPLGLHRQVNRFCRGIGMPP